jgi:hypothetical protein
LLVVSFLIACGPSPSPPAASTSVPPDADRSSPPAALSPAITGTSGPTAAAATPGIAVDSDIPPAQPLLAAMPQVSDPVSVTPLVAPDGTVYVALPNGIVDPALPGPTRRWVVALDTAGRPKTGWPVVVELDPFPLIGDVLLLHGQRGATTWLDALDGRGRRVTGWPVALPDMVCDAPRAAGDHAYLVCRTGDGSSRVIGVTGKGVEADGWPTSLGGAIVGASVDATGHLDLLVGNDGSPSAGDRVWWTSVDENGVERRGVAITLEEPLYGVSFAPDGTAFLRFNGGVPSSCPGNLPGRSYTIETSSIAALDASGIRPGWPYVSDDPLSRPVFGPDGTVFLTAGRVGYYTGGADVEANSPPSRILALDQFGREREGWPVTLPFAAVAAGFSGEAGWSCQSPLFYLVPPVVTPAGTVFALGRPTSADGYHAKTMLAAYRSDGSSSMSEPYVTSAALPSACFGIRNEPCFARLQPVTADGVLYLGIGPMGTVSTGYLDKLLALDAAGRIAGWPLTLTTRNGATTGLAARPGGGLLVGRAGSGESFVVAVDGRGRTVFRTTLTATSPSLRRDSVVAVRAPEVVVRSGSDVSWREVGRLVRGDRAVAVRWERGWVLVLRAGPDLVWGWVPLTGPDGGGSVELVDVSCPGEPLTIDEVARLTPEERLQCFGRGSISFDVRAVRWGHPESWLSNEPAWLLDPNYLCRYGPGHDGPWIDVAVAPGSGLVCEDEPAAGRAFRVTGHFDDPAAATCHSSTVDPTTGQERYGTRIEDVFRCRLQFVVTARTEVDRDG